MRSTITQLEPGDPRRKVGIDNYAMAPAFVAAVRQLLGGIDDDYPRVRELLSRSGVGEVDLDEWTEAAIEGVRQFVALTAPRHGRLPFVVVASLTDVRTLDERIRRMDDQIREIDAGEERSP